MNKISNRSCGLVSIVTWLRVVSHEPTYRKSRALVTIDTSRQLWSEAAGVVAAEGGMVGIVVAMDSKETVIIDNHHGWSENNRPFLLPCTNLWLTL